MLKKIKKGILAPCPVCAGNDINWYGYRYISLRCNDCGFEMYPFNDFASEDEYIKEWNSLNQIDVVIEYEDRQIELVKKIAHQFAEKKAHYNWTKTRIKQGQENLSRAK